jgi:surface antigen
MRSHSWQNLLSKTLEKFINFFKHSFDKIKLISFKNNKNRKNKKVKVFILSSIKENSFLNSDIFLRHVGLLVITAIVIFANYLTSKSANAISTNYNNQTTLAQTAAVSRTDMTETVKKINQVVATPVVKPEDPQKIVERLALKDTIVMADSNYIIKPSILTTSVSAASATTASGSQTNQIVNYTVLGGDTISSIAAKFGISVDTIKSANSLSGDTIQPGQVLVILPFDGILHTVSLGETLSGIVSTYNGNLQDTIDKNGLSQSTTIFAGQKIVIIGGKQPAPVQVASKPKTNKVSASLMQVHSGKGPNMFPFGWCTWYVASRRYVPWHGNANQWPSAARAMGYSVGSTPVPGAILVTNESRWGHVAYVESVSGGSVTISEMNFQAFGRVDTRTVSAGYGVYIY